MKVKICGISDAETAKMAVESGADALGFVFAESKRKITAVEAREIIKHLPNDILKVGVFVNEQAEVIQSIINETGINVIQLHGDETPEFCQTFTVPVIKALSIGTREDLNQLHHYTCDYFLFDSPKGKYRGGNGVAFDWSLLTDQQIGEKKIILAGGLTINNVAQAIETVNPFMVDVSSGVETEGKKDLAKIKIFIKTAKSVK